jgi:hypothetical protein
MVRMVVAIAHRARHVAVGFRLAEYIEEIVADKQGCIITGSLEAVDDSR